MTNDGNNKFPQYAWWPHGVRMWNISGAVVMHKVTAMIQYSLHSDNALYNIYMCYITYLVNDRNTQTRAY